VDEKPTETRASEWAKLMVGLVIVFTCALRPGPLGEAADRLVRWGDGRSLTFVAWLVSGLGWVALCFVYDPAAKLLNVWTSSPWAHSSTGVLVALGVWWTCPLLALGHALD
jgi:hypothetical protein